MIQVIFLDDHNFIGLNADSRLLTKGLVMNFTFVLLRIWYGNNLFH